VRYIEGLTTNELYSSIIVASQIIIDKYDAQKKRIWGRFSFRVIGSIRREVIIIQSGVFENVQVLTRQD
jgi:hypothetical protein